MDAVLFDMDGTLLDSTFGVRQLWWDWADRHGLDREAVFAFAQGRRAIETIQHLAPSADAETEAKELAARELDLTEGVQAIPGAQALLTSIPPARWAVVTSADRELALRRFEAAGLPTPPTMVAADEIDQGKPHPEGYLRAAGLLGVEPQGCVIFEDAPAGLRAATATGAHVFAIRATPFARTVAFEPFCDDLTAVSATAAAEKLTLHIQAG